MNELRNGTDNRIYIMNLKNGQNNNN